MSDLHIDIDRVGITRRSGIYVRARGVNGRWRSVDISELTHESLLQWLREQGGDNTRAEDTVGLLLGHGHLHEV